MNNELKKWAEEQKKELKEAPDAEVMPQYFKGCLHTLSTVIDKITELQSRPVGDVEGYLERYLKGKKIPEIVVGKRCIEAFECVYKDDALDALQALKEDCNRDTLKVQQAFDEYRSKDAHVIHVMQGEINDLTAEVERLKDMKVPEVPFIVIGKNDNPPKQ